MANMSTSYQSTPAIVPAITPASGQHDRPILLKLGGSLITDKRAPECARLAVIEQLAAELAEARRRQPQIQFVIGHGSGSFGHLYGRRYGTRTGVTTAEGWLGYALTGDAAARLNRIVTGALLAAGIPAWSIQPGALVRCVDGRIAGGAVENITQALANGLVPVIYGDVALDDVRGGTIASTEEIFAWLLPHLQPRRVVLAGEVDGIYSADPLVDPTAERIAAITPTTLAAVQGGLGGSHGVDVTGGMVAKVAESVAMVRAVPGLEVIICSGLVPGNLSQALAAAVGGVGTRIYQAEGSMCS